MIDIDSLLSISSRHIRPVKAHLFTLVIIVLAPLVSAQQPDVDWPQHGGSDNIRYSPLGQINRDNVNRLQVAWTYDSGDVPGLRDAGNPSSSTACST